MKTFFDKISLAFRDRTMRNRILFTVGALVVFRLLASIPIPGVDADNLARLLSGSQIFGLFDVFSGGGLSHLSIVMLGVGPYITASIIMQLLTMMSAKIKALFHEEGEAGRQKLSQYTRLVAVPLALLQAFAFLSLLESQNIVANLGTFNLVVNAIVIAAGSMLLMWIGEIMTEFGIGNGVSLIIFAGIVATLPTQIQQFIASFDMAQIPVYLLFAAVSLIVIAIVVLVTEAERPVPVTYAKQVRGGSTFGGSSSYLPLRLNQAGVIPIIFALSILLFPQVIASFLANSANTMLASIGTNIVSFLANQTYYAIAYFALVVIFTYFYTAVTFDPKQMSENLQKGGAFIPGIRPGEPTTQYIAKIVTRITLVGALFLGIVAVLPLIVQGLTGNQALAIGGTALLIAVSVVLDLIKKVDAQVSMREY